MPTGCRTAVIGAATLGPILASLLLATVRDRISTTSMALLLVLVIVAVAALGDRAAGWLATAISTATFDYFLTPPYESFDIHRPLDVQVAVLLLAIGAAVTELSRWGRRQRERASQQHGLLTGLLSVQPGAVDWDAMVVEVSRRLVALWDLDRADFVTRAPGSPVLGPDGWVRRGRVTVDVARTGLPIDCEIWLPLRPTDPALGSFRLVAATHRARPDREKLRVGLALVERLATAAGSRRLPQQQAPRRDDSDRAIRSS